MPEICRFLGIVIAMYHREHGPPHFHAYYGDYAMVVEIDSGVTRGRFPRRAETHVLEWLTLHREELMANWRLAGERKALHKIDPLE